MYFKNFNITNKIDAVFIKMFGHIVGSKAYKAAGGYVGIKGFATLSASEHGPKIINHYPEHILQNFEA